MKKIFMAVAMVACLAISGAAFAEGSGFYLTPRVLLSLQDTGIMSRSSALAGSGVDEYDQFTLGGAVALGIDLWPQQMLPVRLEVEGAMRGNSKRKWYDNGRNVKEVKGLWNNTTLFANVYWDLHNESQFTPFISAGAGLAFNYTGYDFKTLSGENVSADDRFVNFAWNVGAGLSYMVNEALSVDAAYRFVDLGYNEVSATRNGQKFEVGNQPYNNEFSVGLRFSF